MTLQLDCIAEELQSSPDNALSAMRELAVLQLRLGQHQEGLRLLSSLHRHHPSDVWCFNYLALMCPGLGLPSLAVLAADRGLELVSRAGDPNRLRGQLEELRSEAVGLEDRSDAPSDAVEQLKEALRADFGPPVSTDLAELAHRLVPEIALTRVKSLPPMPDPAALSELARRARAMPRAIKAVSAFLPALSTAPPGPKVGRNEPCPCGSGKKHKSCCLTS